MDRSRVISIGRRPDFPRHQTRDDHAHAALEGRPGADQPLRRIADFRRLITSAGIARTNCWPMPPRRPRVAAAWLRCGRPYPQKRLNDAWTLVMGGQFHDTGAGTATPRVLRVRLERRRDRHEPVRRRAHRRHASRGLGLDTQTKGIAVVVYNPLNIAREDVVEANVALPAGTQSACVSPAPMATQVPAQIGRRQGVVPGQSALGGLRGVRCGTGRGAMTSTLRVGMRREACGGRRMPLARERTAIASRSTPTATSPASSTRWSIDELLSAPITAGDLERPPARNGPPGTWTSTRNRLRRALSCAAAATHASRSNGPARVTLEMTRTDTEGSHFVPDRQSVRGRRRQSRRVRRMRSIGRRCMPI